MTTTKMDSAKNKPDANRASEAMKNVPRPSASYSLTLRLKIKNLPGMLGKITSRIGEIGGDIGAIDIAGFEKDYIVRDITVKVRDSAHGDEVVKNLHTIGDIEVVNVSD